MPPLLTTMPREHRGCTVWSKARRDRNRLDVEALPRPRLDVLPMHCKGQALKAGRQAGNVASANFARNNEVYLLRYIALALWDRSGIPGMFRWKILAPQMDAVPGRHNDYCSC